MLPTQAGRGGVMAKLDELRTHGWSYWAGYSHDFRSFMARAWKPRPKPQRVKSPGGADVTLLLWCVSSLGASVDDAAEKCAAMAVAEAGNGAWWNGLPVTKVQD
jgi:hypothetical protein